MSTLETSSHGGIEYSKQTPPHNNSDEAFRRRRFEEDCSKETPRTTLFGGRPISSLLPKKIVSRRLAQDDCKQTIPRVSKETTHREISKKPIYSKATVSNEGTPRKEAIRRIPHRNAPPLTPTRSPSHWPPHRASYTLFVEPCTQMWILATMSSPDQTAWLLGRSSKENYI